MSSAVLHAATGAPASRPRGAFGASRGPRVARRGCVAARATSAGPSDWDLDGAPDGVVLRLAKRLERAWRALPDVADAPCAPDLKSVDAIAEDGDPTTAVRIENLVFTNAAFRKMHLEVAWGLGGLEVMHVVVYPWASVAAPIYAADLVAFNGRVTLCIADVCPTERADSIQESDADASTPKKNEGVPRVLADAAKALKHAMLTNAPAIEPRGIPDWGTPILSKEACVCVGPPVGDFPEQEQAQAFAEYAYGLFQAYASYVNEICLPPTNESEEKDIDKETKSRLAAQSFFCEKQLENDKTRKALERSMGEERTARYMTTVLFDVTERTPTRPATR
jgi:phycocyanobilin:ferredoxin oxidoreductase